MHEIQKANKYSVIQVMKDEKSVINKCKKEITKIKAKRVAEKKRMLQLLLNNSQGDEMDLDIN